MRTITLNSLLAGLLIISTVCNSYGREPGNNTGQFKPQGTPFVFLENKGQITDQFRKHRDDIDFKIAGEGINVFIGSGQIQYQWIKNVPAKDGEIATKNQVEFCPMLVSLDGANKNARLVKEEQERYHENYYLPQCPDGAIAHSYSKITYKDIYPNIDWVLYAKNGKLKYDFVVHPGGNVNDIKLKFDGDSALKIKNKKFTAYTRFGSIEEDAPYAYELQTMPDGKEIKKDVAASFVLDDEVLRFETGAYKGTLVIDPTIQWSHYFGWTNVEIAKAVVTQHDFTFTYKTFFIGKTNSYANIFWGTKPPVHQTNLGEPYTNSGTFDGFVAAYSAGGIKEWTTYYGGDTTDELVAGACDVAGNVYVVGNTRSTTGIATAGTWRQILGGEPVYLASQYIDGFIAKLNSDGSRAWGTYYGGESWEEMRAITLDNSNNIYVTGWTYSSTLIATPGTHKPTLTAGKDVFLAKFTSGGTKTWSTYYGDDKNEEGNAVVCDRSGNVYLAGITSDDTCGRTFNFAKDSAIATVGAHQFWPANRNQQLCPPPPGPPPIPAPPINDGFLVKFNSLGVRQWGTYYGGSNGDDYISALAFDTTRFVTPAGKVSNGLLYIGGYAKSSNGISSPEGWQATYGGGESDGFVAAFLPTGERYWGSYFGGANIDEVKSIALDTKGSLLVAGATNSSGLSTSDAFGKVQSNRDGFLAVFNQGARQSCTYFGGGVTDIIYGIGCNSTDEIYIAGSTTSSDSIAYPNGSSTYNGFPDEDAFVAKFLADFPSYYQFGPLLPGNFFCPGQTFTAGLQVMHSLNSSSLFLPGNTFTVQMSDITGNFVNAQTIGSNSGSATFTIPLNTPPGMGYKLRAISSKPLMISNDVTFGVSKIPYPQITSSATICEGDTLKLNATDTITGGIVVAYKWVNIDTSFQSSSKDTFITNATAAKSGRYIISALADNACYAADTVNITVHPTPVITTTTNNGPVCEGVPLNLTTDADTTGGGTLIWSGPGGFSSQDKNPVITTTTTNKSGVYTVGLIRNGCLATGMTNVQIDPQPKINSISSNSPVCYEDTIRLFSATEPTATVFAWTGPAGFSSTLPNPTIPNSGDQHKGFYKLTGVLGNCSITDSVAVDITQLFTIQAGSNSPVTVGHEIKLTATDAVGATYTWSGPNGFISADQNPVIADAKHVHAGPYTVVAKTSTCRSSAVTIVEIRDAAVSKPSQSLYPNPNKGEFTLKLVLNQDQTIPVVITNKLGQKVHEFKVTSLNKLVEEKITLPGYLSAGTYNLNMIIGKDNKVIPFAIGK